MIGCRPSSGSSWGEVGDHDSPQPEVRKISTWPESFYSRYRPTRTVRRLTRFERSDVLSVASKQQTPNTGIRRSPGRIRLHDDTAYAELSARRRRVCSCPGSALRRAREPLSNPEVG